MLRVAIEAAWCRERRWRRRGPDALEQLHRRSEIAATHEEGVDAAGGLAAFADGPDDERLTAADVAGGEHAGHARHVILVRDHVAAVVELQAELADRAVLFGAEEAEGEEAQVAVEFELAARNFLELRRAARRVLLPLQADAVELLHRAVAVTGEGFRVDREVADVRREDRFGFLVRAARAVDHRPQRPRRHAFVAAAVAGARE